MSKAALGNFSLKIVRSKRSLSVIMLRSLVQSFFSLKVLTNHSIDFLSSLASNASPTTSLLPKIKLKIKHGMNYVE